MKPNTGITQFAHDVIAKLRKRFFVLIFLSAICAIADGFRLVIAFMLLPFLGVPLEGSAAKLSELLKQFLEAIGLSYNLTAVGMVVITIFALQTLLELLQNWYQYNYAHSYALVWRKQLFSGLARARWRYFLDTNRGQLINLLSQETAKLSHTVIRFLLFLSTLLVALAYLGASFAISVEASLLMVLVGLSMIIFNSLFLKRLTTHARASVKGNNEMMGIAQEFLNNIKAIKASPHGYTMERLVSSALMTIFRSERAVASLPNTSRIIAEFLIMMALVSGILIASHSSARIASSEILLVMVLFIRAYGKVTMTMTSAQQMYVLLPSYKFVSETYKKIIAEEEPLWQTGQQLPQVALHCIRFESVSVQYGNKAALDNISVELKPNSIVALVGTSGAGKTTFVDTLLRLTDIDSGRITWNEMDIRNFNVQSWRSRFGYVTQELTLINGSLADNIRLLKPDANMEEVCKAARMAHADEFIARLPERYDTQVGEMGLKLSGGQRQRIAVARALINDPPILILDEATSALDAESEGIVMQTILGFREHKLIIVIAHRLSTIKEADKILVLEHGRLVEEGNWDTLVGSAGRFNQLWKKLT